MDTEAVRSSLLAALINLNPNIKIYNDRQVVRENDFGNLEIVHLNLLAVQHKIQVSLRSFTGECRQVLSVGILQAGCSQKEFDLVLTPEHVEITRDDAGFLRVFHHGAKVT